jgi:hypothetical protein
VCDLKSSDEYVMRDEGLIPHILNLGSRWRSEVNLPHFPLCSLGNTSRYPLSRKKDGTQRQSNAVKKRLVPQTGLEPRVLGIQPVSYLL